MENDYINEYYKKIYYLLEEEDINYNSNVEIDLEIPPNCDSSDLMNIANKQKQYFFYLEEKSLIEKGYNRPNKKCLFF